MSCSWVMPLASRVKIWFSISLMVRAMVVSSCSQPTRMCCGGRHGRTEGGEAEGGESEGFFLLLLFYYRAKKIKKNPKIRLSPNTRE